MALSPTAPHLLVATAMDLVAQNVPIPTSPLGAVLLRRPARPGSCLLLASRRGASPQRFLGWCLKIDIFNLLKIESLAERRLLFFHSLSRFVLHGEMRNPGWALPGGRWEPGPVNRLPQNGRSGWRKGKKNQNKINKKAVHLFARSLIWYFHEKLYLHTVKSATYYSYFTR